jgi:hypothetical protein
MVSQLKKVALGFRLCFIGTLIYVLALVALILVIFIGGGLFMAGGGLAALGIMGLLCILLLVVMAGGSITDLVGRFFCLAVPDRAGAAKPLIIISIVLQMISLFSSFGSNAMADRGVGMGASMAAGLCGPASFILFLFFIKSFAKYIRRVDLGETAMVVLWMLVGVVALLIFGFVLVLVGGVAALGGGRGAAGGLGLFAFLIWIAAFVLGIVAIIRYISLLRNMWEATIDHIRKVKAEQKVKRAGKPKKVIYDDQDDVFDDDVDDRHDDRDDTDGDAEDDDRDKRQRRTYLDW